MHQGVRSLKALILSSAIALLTSPLLAQETVTIGSEEFGQAVREYLLENPEVIFEAVDVYETRQQQASADAAKAEIANNHDAIYDEEDALVFGNPEGSFAVVEFIDYNCGYCQKSHSEMAEVFAANPDMKLLVRQLPILKQESLDTAKVVLAVKNLYGGEDARKLHDYLYDEAPGADSGVALDYAETLGHDRAEIEAAMDDEKIYAAIAEVHDLAEKLQVSGTPGFVIGDELVGGYIPASQMNQIIANKMSES